jgi:hypothetical protein
MKVEKDAVYFNTFESASLYHWSVYRFCEPSPRPAIPRAYPPTHTVSMLQGFASEMRFLGYMF